LLSEVVKKVYSNVVKVDVKVNGEWGNGSGLVIDKEGTILTCEHVVCPRGRDAEFVGVSQGKEMSKEVEIVKRDKNCDAALLEAKHLSVNENIKPRNFEQVNIGDDCFVLGYPIGLNHLTLSRGVVSAKGIGLVKQFMFNLIQIDARVNYGNSGGPVFDTETSELIGILTMKYIPFLDTIEKLHDTVTKIRTNIKQPDSLTGIDLGKFFNTTHVSLQEISHALTLVQIGIGWVIPIDILNRGFIATS
jgi:S1-C subfamily serine protease